MKELNIIAQIIRDSEYSDIVFTLADSNLKTLFVADVEIGFDYRDNIEVTTIFFKKVLIAQIQADLEKTNSDFLKGVIGEKQQKIKEEFYNLK